MTRRSFAQAIGALLLAATITGGGVALAARASGSNPILSGPSVLVDQPQAKPGERVRVSVEGFDAPYVTVSICGNEARRGSTDCDLVGSKGFELLDGGELTWTELVVSEPPAPCPCVIRVSTPTSDVVSVVPFSVTGHPVEELSGPRRDDPLVEIVVKPELASVGVFGWMRASLGGASDYDVTVSVHNLTQDTLRRVSLDGSVGRDEFDVSTTFDLKNPGVLAGGQTSTQVVRVRVPAPAIGTFVWRVSAGGAGPTVTTLVDRRETPWMLIVLVGLLILDIALVMTRWLTARRARREADAAANVAAVVDATHDRADRRRDRRPRTDRRLTVRPQRSATSRATFTPNATTASTAAIHAFGFPRRPARIANGTATNAAGKTITAAMAKYHASIAVGYGGMRGSYSKAIFRPMGATPLTPKMVASFSSSVICSGSRTSPASPRGSGVVK